MTRTEYIDAYDKISNYFHQRKPFARIVQLFWASIVVTAPLIVCSVILHAMNILPNKQFGVIIICLLVFMFANASFWLLFSNKNEKEDSVRFKMIEKLEKFFKEEKLLEEFWVEVEKENQGYFFGKK